MLKYELLESGSIVILINVVLKVRNGSARWPNFKHYFADFIVDKTSHGFNFQTIGINNPNFIQIGISLSVMSVNNENKLP